MRAELVLEQRVDQRLATHREPDHRARLDLVEEADLAQGLDRRPRRHDAGAHVAGDVLVLEIADVDICQACVGTDIAHDLRERHWQNLATPDDVAVVLQLRIVGAVDQSFGHLAPRNSRCIGRLPECLVAELRVIVRPGGPQREARCTPARGSNKRTAGVFAQHVIIARCVEHVSWRGRRHPFDYDRHVTDSKQHRLVVRRRWAELRQQGCIRRMGAGQGLPVHAMLEAGQAVELFESDPPYCAVLGTNRGANRVMLRAVRKVRK